MAQCSVKTGSGIQDRCTYRDPGPRGDHNAIPKEKETVLKKFLHNWCDYILSFKQKETTIIEEYLNLQVQAEGIQ